MSYVTYTLSSQPADGRYIYDVPFPYLEKDHVYCYIGEEGSLETIEWIDDDTIEIMRDPEDPIPLSSEINIVRRTPKDEMMVSFQDGQLLDEGALTTNYLQILYALQEFLNIPSDFVYRPIDGDIGDILSLLEGELTESHLAQDLFEKIQLITDIEGDVATLDTSVSEHESDITALTTQVNENSTTAAQLQIQADDNTAEITSLAQYVSDNESAVAAVEQMLFAGEYDAGTPEDPADDTIAAEYTLKMNLDINGESRVAGFGLMLEEGEPSEFMIIADKFQIVDPNGSNIESATPVFTVGTVDGVTMCGIRGELIVENSILSSALTTGCIEVYHLSDDAESQVSNTMQQFEDILNAPAYDTSTGVTLIQPGAILLQGGDTLDNITAEDISETANKKWAGDWSHTADETLIDGGKIFVGSYIQIGNEDGASDYCFLDEGDIEFWQYIDGQHILAKTLKRVEVGQCANGTTTQLSGKWAIQPSIMISPHQLQTYDPNYSSQKQEIQCEAVNPVEISPGVWEFTPEANLVISDNEAGYIMNEWGTETEATYTNDNSAHHEISSGLPPSVVGIEVTVKEECYLRKETYDWDGNPVNKYSWVRVTPYVRVYATYGGSTGWQEWIQGPEKYVKCDTASGNTWKMEVCET